MKKFILSITLLIVSLSVISQTSDKYRRYLKRNGDTLEVRSGKIMKIPSIYNTSIVNKSDSGTIFTSPKQVSDSNYAHNYNYMNFGNGFQVGGGDTINTIMIRSDTLFFVSGGSTYYSLLVPYNKEVGNPHRVYVSTSGSDSNDGRDSTHAVQTLTYVQTLAQPGDTICLKRGDTFSYTGTTNLQINESGISGNPIVWNGNLWGTGNDAEIACTEDAPNANKTLIHVYDSRYLVFEHIKVDGFGYAIGGIVIGGSHNTQGGGLQNDEHDITVQNCEFTRCGDSTLVSDYRIGIFVRTKLTDIHDIIIQNNIVHGISAHGISSYQFNTYYDHTLTPHKVYNLYIGYNTLYNIRYGGNNDGSMICLVNRNENVTIEHNNLTATTNDNYATDDFIVIDRNEEYYTGEIDILNVVIRYNHVYDYKPTDSFNGVYIGTSTDDPIKYTAKVYSNLFYDISTASVYDNCIRAGAAHDGDLVSGSLIEIYNNTFFHTGEQALVYITEDHDNQFIVKNNIFYTNYTGGSMQGLCITAPDTFSFIHSNNLFYRPNTDKLVKIVNTYYGASTISSWESTAVASDPTFVTNFSDLHLQTGSPADGAGITITGLTYTDYDKVVWDDPPAIGAYEKK